MTPIVAAAEQPTAWSWVAFAGVAVVLSLGGAAVIRLNRRGARGALRAAFIRYLGPPPADESMLARLSWARRVSFRAGAPWVPIVIADAILINVPWFTVLSGVLFVLWVEGLVRLTWKIRRAQRSELTE